MTTRATPLLALLVLAACAPATETYRWKSGAALSLVDRDLFACTTAGAREVPFFNDTATTEIYTTPIQTTCQPLGNGQTRCTTTGGQVMGGQVYSYDANADLRRDYVNRCMAGKGYSAASVPSCAPKVIPADISALTRKGSRPPVEGACAVSLKGGTHVLVYPGEAG